MSLTAMAAAGMIFATVCSNNAANRISTAVENTMAEATVAETTLAGEESSSVEAENLDLSADDGLLVIAEQGMFSAGGITVTSEGTFDPENHWEESGVGQTAHVDHANVFYQIPENEMGLLMVFLHGYGQSRMGWMTTPDGREGWPDLFLRKGHSVFLVDEPRRGEAGATSVSGDISTKTVDQRWYTQFRIGRWEDGKSVANEGSQFLNDEISVDRFFRQMTPDTGMTSDMGADFDGKMVAKAMAATIDKVYEMTGKDSILVTHFQGGRAGWPTAKYTDHIAVIVAVEPGGAPEVDSEDYNAVVEKNIPVVFYFGDYIDNGDPAIEATAAWKGMCQICYNFADVYTAKGGISQVVDLLKEGITGNDHFIFQDYIMMWLRIMWRTGFRKM
uniref:alpha/beta hydrolase n=1 Tax=Enterocloster clostridioformis TaxID=1531 RepID=UPI002ED1D6D4